MEMAYFSKVGVADITRTQAFALMCASTASRASSPSMHDIRRRGEIQCQLPRRWRRWRHGGAEGGDGVVVEPALHLCDERVQRERRLVETTKDHHSRVAHVVVGVRENTLTCHTGDG